ncbi:hypothetical protein ALO41_102980 [Pseudomonas amygdali pv. ulmi]|uniref:Uncharacterized protein n=1 Tax=Pseudomonas amygdali pv. ulmi TaxID=251720 RepID=A0A0Q0CH31_PSEA0|nr:hypothetical protein ALO41_102980 [Pseudomonas amygdali pv. ulmi]
MSAEACHSTRSPPRAGFFVFGSISLFYLYLHNLPSVYPFENNRTEGMQAVKRFEIKRRPLSDITLAGLEADLK